MKCYCNSETEICGHSGKELEPETNSLSELYHSLNELEIFTGKENLDRMILRCIYCGQEVRQEADDD